MDTNPSTIRTRRWRANHPEASKAACRRYYLENIEKERVRKKDYITNRRKTDIDFRLKTNLRNRFKIALKHQYKAGSAVHDLGCSIEDFKTYIAAKFTHGMSWENYGEWQLDHIVPLSKFDITQRDQMLIAFHYTNYQPMWSLDNTKKGNFHVLDFTEGVF